jgi:hypothetical protein
VTPKTTTAACPDCQTDQKVKVDGRLYKHDDCPGGGKPIGEARIPKPHHGWYTDYELDLKLRRVTGILNASPKGEKLLYWAGNTVAATAMEYLPKLVRDSLDPYERTKAYNWLRHAHTRKKDERGYLGDAVHKVIECSILDLPVPSPADLVPDKVTDPTARAVMAEEIAACIKHFARWVDDFEVEFTASEMVIANYTHLYAGKLDWMACIGGYGHRMGDTKTGGELDEKLDDGSPKGVYPEAGIQLSAYRHGEVCWLKDGSKVPLPDTDPEGVVLHLRPEGYRLYPARAGEREFEQFLALIQVDQWITDEAKSVIGEPLSPRPSSNDDSRKVA